MKVDNIKLQEIFPSSGLDGGRDVHVVALCEAMEAKSRSPEMSVGVKVLKLDDKVATLHFLANNVEVTVLEDRLRGCPLSLLVCEVKLRVLTLAAVLPLVNLLSRAIPKIFPSVFHDIHGRISVLSFDPVFLCHWVTSFALLTRG